MGGTLLAKETSQSWERPGEHGEDEEVVWSSSPSGPLEPCFMIFLYLERLFWNHIFTFSKQKRKKNEHYNTCNKNAGHIFFYNLSNSFQDIRGLFLRHPFFMMILTLKNLPDSLNGLCWDGLSDIAAFHYTRTQELFRPAIFMKAVKHLSDNNNHSVKICLDLVELKWLPESLLGRFW